MLIAIKDSISTDQNANKSYQAGAWIFWPFVVELSHGFEYKKLGSHQHKTLGQGTDIPHPDHKTETTSFNQHHPLPTNKVIIFSTYSIWKSKLTKRVGK